MRYMSGLATSVESSGMTLAASRRISYIMRIIKLSSIVLVKMQATKVMDVTLILGDGSLRYIRPSGQPEARWTVPREIWSELVSTLIQWRSSGAWSLPMARSQAAFHNLLPQTLPGSC